MPAALNKRQWSVLTRLYAAHADGGLPRDPTLHMAAYSGISPKLVLFFQHHAFGALVEEYTLNGTERLRLTPAGLAFYAREKVQHPDAPRPLPDTAGITA